MRRFSIDINGENFLEALKSWDGSGRAFKVIFRTQCNFTEGLGLLDLKIYNLAESTQILTHTEEHSSILRLSAGYVDNFAPIFNGYIEAVFREREETNIITHIVCRSGFATARTKLNLSFGRNSDIVTILNAVANAGKYGLRIDPAQFDDSPKLARGYPLNGNFTECMKKLAEQFDFQWAFDGSVIVIDRPKKPRNDETVEVNLTTGLIGYPEATSDQTGVFAEWEMRLSPQVRLGTVANLRSKFATFNTGNLAFVKPGHEFNLNGKYVIRTVSHEGDSWGDTWRTKVMGEKVNG